MLNIPWCISDTEYAKFSFLRPFLLLAADVSAGRTARELWRKSQESSPAGIMPWLSMLTYHPGDEQQARWWPQFWDIVSPHHNQSIVSYGLQSERSQFGSSVGTLDVFIYHVIQTDHRVHPSPPSLLSNEYLVSFPGGKARPEVTLTNHPT
jgi:hypothetical protein